jgi:hypothetical protein
MNKNSFLLREFPASAVLLKRGRGANLPALPAHRRQIARLLGAMGLVKSCSISSLHIHLNATHG